MPLARGCPEHRLEKADAAHAAPDWRCLQGLGPSPSPPYEPALSLDGGPTPARASVAEAALATRWEQSTRPLVQFLRTLGSTLGPSSPLRRTTSAPCSEDVGVGRIRKHLSTIETHHKVDVTLKRWLNASFLIWDPRGPSGCHQKQPGTQRRLHRCEGRQAWALCSGLTSAEAQVSPVWAASLGHLGLQGAGQIEVPPDGIVVGAGAKRHKQVPDGVGEGDPPVTLEEHCADAVEGASGHQLPDALGVGLSARARVRHRSEERPATSRAPSHRPHPPESKRPKLPGGVSTP